MATLAHHARTALIAAGYTANDWCAATLAGNSIFTADRDHYETGAAILTNAGFALEPLREVDETDYLIAAYITRATN